MRDVIDGIERFEEALRAGRRRAAYEAARAAWRACRAPELAALVERAAERFPTGELPAAAAMKQRAWMEAWLAAARARAPYDGRRLLGALDEVARAHRGSVVAACLDELVGEADDPSLTLPACALAGVAGGTVSFGSWGKVLTRLFTILERSGDPRAVDALRALAADAAANPEARGTSTSAALVERIPKAIAKLEKRLTENGGAAELDAATAARARAALALVDGELPEAAEEGAAAPSAEEALYAAVLADPDDEEARAVWADALQQRGDARGELIALQLAAASGNAKAAKAAAKLVKAHWRAWVGPLAPAIVTSTVEFDRGLLDACATDVRRKAVADAIFGHPGWGTVRRLTFGGYGALTGAMRRLKEAVNVPEPALEALATISLPRLRALSVVPSPTRGADDGLSAGRPVGRGLKALAAARGLPSLTSLSLWFRDREWRDRYFDRGPDDYRWVFAAPFGAQLESFAVRGDWPDWPDDRLADWVALFRAAAPSLRRFALHATNSRLIVSLADGTGAVELGGGARASDDDRMLPWAQRETAAARALVENAGLRWVR